MEYPEEKEIKSELHDEIWLQNIRTNGNQRSARTVRSSGWQGNDVHKKVAHKRAPQDTHISVASGMKSSLVRDVVLRMTMDSAKDFLCTAKSSLMSTAGQNRVFHHLLFPLSNFGPNRTQTRERIRSAEQNLPDALPKALTVLAMASRKRRMHLAPCALISEPYNGRDPLYSLATARQITTPPRAAILAVGGRPIVSPDVPLLGWD
jgi:hypothetical protein